MRFITNLHDHPKISDFTKKSQNSKSGPIRGNDSQIIFHIVFHLFIVMIFRLIAQCTIETSHFDLWPHLTSFWEVCVGLCWFVLVCVSLCWFVCFITTPCGQCYQQKSHKKPSLGTVLYKFFKGFVKEVPVYSWWICWYLWWCETMAVLSKNRTFIFFLTFLLLMPNVT